MSDLTQDFEFTPSGPFDLARQNRHFGGWPTHPDDPDAVVMAFPVEGRDAAAAVVLRQAAPDGPVRGEVHGPRADSRAAIRQALAALSLDADGAGWPAVGDRDPAIGELQARYGCLRPVLFHSPYEAAAAFVIGHRIRIAQGRALRAGVAAAAGETFTIGGRPFSAFPSPAAVLAAPELPGIPSAKLDRLRAIARAAQDGWLRRDRLRDRPAAAALAELETLPGVGPFFAQGILYRGAGVVDDVTDDDVTAFAVTRRYGPATAAATGAAAGRAQVLEIAERWRPYRMWAVVLLHVWVRAEVGLPARTFARRPGAAAVS
jgi:DNA-3-methyladenine glycosylase II